MTYAYMRGNCLYETETNDDPSITYFELEPIPEPDGFNVSVPSGIVWDGVRIFRAFTQVNVQEKKIADLAALRYEKERAGTMFGEMPIPTDDGTKANITAAYVLAVQNPDVTRNWKVGPTTFMEFNAATIMALGDAIQSHIQACFDHEKELIEAILACTTLEELDAIDIEAGWPE